MSKEKAPERIPQTFSFTSLSEMMTEVRMQSSQKRQIAIIWDGVNKCWQMTVHGLTS